MQQKCFSIALAGNPNSGKTTIFNNLTGTRQKVGNWAGVTVEKKEGRINRFGYDIRITDLPGTYSLTPFSIEEIVARDFVLDEEPDIVINIIDSSNLERSLYLATQVRELNCNVLFVLNMADLARQRGIKIDDKKLSELLDLPVVFTVGNRNKGMDILVTAAIELIESEKRTPARRRVKYSKDIEKSISAIEALVEARSDDNFSYDARWTAIKLLEDDKIVKKRIREKIIDRGDEIIEQVEKHRECIHALYNDDPEIIMTDERYGFIQGIIKEVVTLSSRQRVDISRNIDLVLTNRFCGFPIFIFFIWAMFQLTFSAGAYPMEWIDMGVNLFSAQMSALLPDGVIKDLFINGILTGLGSVIIFLPNILILFFFIAIFEDTGYMARSAFLMDRIMHLIGLHGKSFIPMLIGFGCNVPAVISARTLESEKDRILTILITPFMSCSAKLPVYIMLAGTFFKEQAGTVIFIIYLAGIILGMLTGRLFRATLLAGKDAPFVMELPPYRVPMLKSLIIHMWDRSKMFLKKMGGVILAGSVIIWVLSSFPIDTEGRKAYLAEKQSVMTFYTDQTASSKADKHSLLQAEFNEKLAKIDADQAVKRVEYSLMGRIGKFLSPVFEPVGIDWRGSIALLTGFVAKEVVISSMSILYAVEKEEDALEHALVKSGMSPLSALSMMFFVLLYVPCLATVTTTFRETGSLKWMMFGIVYSCSLAWLVCFCIYQGGRLLA
ncbi:ferrous iron transport protein B [Desulfobacterales bacterium HSG16]|nr:ferrous iron transport protein B [Desulfobacterales bacterium HSG16]